MARGEMLRRPLRRALPSQGIAESGAVRELSEVEHAGYYREERGCGAARDEIGMLPEWNSLPFPSTASDSARCVASRVGVSSSPNSGALA